MPRSFYVLDPLRLVYSYRKHYSGTRLPVQQRSEFDEVGQR
jgi:hypothetical protein